MRQKNYWSYFAFSQIHTIGCRQTTVVPAELLPHEAKQTQPFGISKI